ncbi:peroxin 11c [Sporothrix schenckii 1099-18]|uniref:Peroxin 11c n=2 Tax=Sporothrix schenckii TaxID=29908 RepID=U7Q3C4_SPOS1|nr:peroxin 11c [Sporothrix schenckii 1099-18]ERT01221.1 hypothetical protein HMPREF1624_02463 [Sporothrix schenckii ATCC 58251]KJR88365.1 peroxin 11c [Sporothrix schenckii 1099-18]
MSDSPAARAKAVASAAIDPANIDAFIVKLNKVMQTPGGIDAVLAAVCYGARLGSVILNTAGGRALFHEPVRQLAAVLLALPTRASASALVLVTSSGNKNTNVTTAGAAKAAAGASALVLAQRLRALGTLLTEARMMLRLWGLLSMYVWARQLVGQLLARRRVAAAAQKEKAAAAAAAAEPSDKTKEGEEKAAVAEKEAAAKVVPPTSTAETLVGWTQLLSCIVYQVTENAAYLSGKGVLGATPAQQGKLYRWSSRAFSVFVAAELGRLAVQSMHQTTDTPAKKAQALELHKNMVRYASLAPVMAHWGMEKGFLSDVSLTILGCIPAAIQIHKTWKET